MTDGTSGDGTLGITVKASSASDAAGNTSTASSASTTYTALETVPSSSVAGPYSDAACTTAATYGKSGGAVYYKVTYSSPNLLTVSLSGAGITVNNTGGMVSGSTAPVGTPTIYSGGTTTTPVVKVTDGTSGDGTLGITVNASSAHDAAGNYSTESSASSTYTALESLPSASVAGPYSDAACTTAATYGKSGGAVYYQVTYSSPNTLTVSLSGAGITVNNTGGIVSGSTAPEGTATIYSGGTTTTPVVKVTDGTSGDGTLGITVNASSAHDAAGNYSTESSASSTYTALESLPGASVAGPYSDAACTTAATYGKSGGAVYYKVTYSSPNTLTVSLSGAGITVNNTGGIVSGSTAPEGTPTIYSGGTTTTPVVKVTDGTSGDGTLGITVNASSAYDAAGNYSTESSASSTYTALESLPGASVAGPYSDAACTTAATYGKSGGAVYYKVTYSSPNSLTVNLTGSGITVDNPTTVSGSTAPEGTPTIYSGGTTTTPVVKVTDGTSGDGTLGITVNASTAYDAAGNYSTVSNSSTTYMALETVPSASVAGPYSSSDCTGSVLTAIKGATVMYYKVTYSSPNSLTVDLEDAGITVNPIKTGAVIPTGSAVVYSGGTTTTPIVVVTSGADGDGTLEITVNASTAYDAAGNYSNASDGTPTCYVENTAPSVASIAGPFSDSACTSAVTAGQASAKVYYLVTYSGPNPLSAINLNASTVLPSISAAAALTYTAPSYGTLAVSNNIANKTSTISFVVGSSTSCDGTLSITDIPLDAANDAAGNQTADYATASSAFTVDNVGITLYSTLDGGNNVYYDGSTYKITAKFIEPISGLGSIKYWNGDSTNSTSAVVHTYQFPSPLMTSTDASTYTTATTATLSNISMSSTNFSFFVVAASGQQSVPVQLSNQSISAAGTAYKGLQRGGSVVYSTLSSSDSGASTTSRAASASFASNRPLVPVFVDQAGEAQPARAPSAEIVMQPVSLVYSSSLASRAASRTAPAIDASGLSILQRYADKAKPSGSTDEKTSNEVRYAVPAPAPVQGPSAAAPSQASAPASQAGPGPAGTGAAGGGSAPSASAPASAPQPSRNAPSPEGGGAPGVDIFAEQEDSRGKEEGERCDEEK